MQTRAPAIFATCLTITTYVLVVFGSAVRANHAGLACPDWPMCFGEVIPTLDFGVALEWGHRVLAGFVSLAFATLGGWLFVTKRMTGPRAVLWGIGAVLLCTQVVLGGLTVLELLAEWTVVAHLLTGNSFTATLLLLSATLWHDARPVQRPSVASFQRLVALGVGVLVVTQLGLGGWVAAAEAGTACGPAWPNCGGSAWFPTFSGLQGIQVIHRTMAYIVLAGVVVGFLATRGSGRLGRIAGVVMALTFLQAGIGIANVLLMVPVETTVLHSAGAAALVLSTVWWNFEAWMAPVRASASSALPVARPLEAK